MAACMIRRSSFVVHRSVPDQFGNSHTVTQDAQRVSSDMADRSVSFGKQCERQVEQTRWRCRWQHQNRVANTKKSGDRHRMPVAAIAINYRFCILSAMIFGVMKISNSVLSLTRPVVLNKLPSSGISPKNGTLVS